MSMFKRISVLGLLLSALLGGQLFAQTKVLVFSKTAGFRHSSIPD